MRKINITLDDISMMVAESVRIVKGLVTEEEKSPLTTVNDKPERQYEAIGFANKFYTLWLVQERKYSKTYIYRKNISFSKEKAMSLYPDAVFDENLRGRTQTFTVRVGVGSSREFFGNEAVPKKMVKEGEPVHIDNFLVNNISQAKTRYGSMYISVRGEDVSGLDTYVINVFDKRNDMPSVGDILSLDGTVAFYNEKKDYIYIKDASWDFVTRKSDSDPSGLVEDGEKLKDVKMVVSQYSRGVVSLDGLRLIKPGFIVLSDENGASYYVDTLVSDFRTGAPTSKFKEAEKWFRKGAMFLVSGTVQKRDGFNRIIRAKFKLAEEGEEEEKEKRYRPFIKVIENKSQGTTRREMENTNETKVYSLPTDKYDEFLKFLYNTCMEHNGRLEINWNNCELDMEKIRKMAEENISDNIDYDSISFNITIPATRENLTYSLFFYIE